MNLTLSSFIAVVVSSVFLLTGCIPPSQTNLNKTTSSPETASGYVIDPSDFLSTPQLLEGAQTGEVSDKVVEGMLRMREEEKLARDVYTTLGNQWNLNIFTNIASSEQTHMDAMEGLLKLFSIEDPVHNTDTGAFTSPEMRELYQTLTTKGSTSVLDALMVGATIEDLDLYDLNGLMLLTTNPDILRVYQNLAKGSRNHLRAFQRQIMQQGGSYTPQYISKEDFEQILQSAQERGR